MMRTDFEFCVTGEVTARMIAARERDAAYDRIRESEARHRLRVEIGDALRKLRTLALCDEDTQTDGSTRFRALPLDEACRRLDVLWDHYFEYNV